MPWVTVSAGSPPARCCTRRPGGGGGSASRRSAGFFCRSHRALTLHAQYRFLPALAHVQQSAAFRRGAFKWVVVVDDDAFVFVRRLLWLLARLDETKPLCAPRRRRHERDGARSLPLSLQHTALTASATRRLRRPWRLWILH